MKKWVSLLLVVMMLASVLAGCGGTQGTGDASDTKPAEKVVKTKVIDIELTQEEYAFGVDKDQPELLEQVNAFIAKIKADGTFDAVCEKYFGSGTPEPVASAKEDASKDQLVVATNAAFEPFEYTVGDQYAGIDMEIAGLLAKELGKELVIVNMDFDAVCLTVGQHKCDIAMAGLTVKEDRKAYVTFTDSYYNASQKLIVKGDDTTFDACKTADDVTALLTKMDKTTKVGVQTGTTGQFFVEGDEDWGFDGFAVTSVGYKNGSLAVQDMLNGNLNFVVIDSAPAACIVEKINAVA
ncbi:MAG: transporter substrate-binding domain-containing protein [Clostridia bacterium]|nr:transporter substrate-binding domain-containing protein [Clostridia bacterium]